MSVGMQRFWTGAAGAGPPVIGRAHGVHIWDTTRQALPRRDLRSDRRQHRPRQRARARRPCASRPSRVCFAYSEQLRVARQHAPERDARASSQGPGSIARSSSRAVRKRWKNACSSRAAWRSRAGRTERYKVISRDPSYHGSTRATMALSADPRTRPTSRVWPPGHPRRCALELPPAAPACTREQHALQCAEQLRTRIASRRTGHACWPSSSSPSWASAAAPRSAPAAYYRRVREICDESGVLLIHDEIVSGAGRSGTFLAADHWPGARPDLAILAKGLGGGYVPLAAFLAPAALVDAVAGAGGFHVGHTYKAHPLACAVGPGGARRDRGATGSSSARAKPARTCASSWPGCRERCAVIGDVRGLGMLNAVEIVADRRDKRMWPRATRRRRPGAGAGAGRGAADLRAPHARRALRRLDHGRAAADRHARRRR